MTPLLTTQILTFNVGLVAFDARLHQRHERADGLPRLVHRTPERLLEGREAEPQPLLGGRRRAQGHQGDHAARPHRPPQGFASLLRSLIPQMLPHFCCWGSG